MADELGMCDSCRHDCESLTEQATRYERLAAFLFERALSKRNDLDDALERACECRVGGPL